MIRQTYETGENRQRDIYRVLLLAFVYMAAVDAILYFRYPQRAAMIALLGTVHVLERVDRLCGRPARVRDLLLRRTWESAIFGAATLAVFLMLR